MGNVERDYLPAAGRDWALPFYDPFVSLLGINKVRRALFDVAALHPTDRVLDIGCGTGTMAILIKQLYPDVHVCGLDPDARALARAKRKAARSATSIQFDQGFSDKLPYSDGSFDHVFSSFMFHHVPADQKESTLCEVRRVLKPDGSFLLVDFAGPEHGGCGWLTHLFHSSERLKDNSEARIIALMRRAGFLEPKKVMKKSILLGGLRINYFEGFGTV